MPHDGLRPHTRAQTSEEEMQRTAINPWDWSASYGYHQGEVVTDHTRTLFCAGQTSVDANGAPQHADDMGAQLSLALDNLESVLAEAGMGLENLVRLNIYTTDVDRLFESYGVLAARTGAAQVAPPGTLLGVARLAFPELLVELEATAVA
jgi:enamine deaminase RidA (YjgF/YER057c/UK114 family)